MNSEIMNSEIMNSRTILPGRCPDIGACRAGLSGMSGLVYCLNEGRSLCDYPLSFGNVHFCPHPQSMEIVARTKSLKKP
jgi:hypothetical protein